jgi:hypothetical protein
MNKENQGMKKSFKLISLVSALLVGLSLYASSVWAETNSPTQVVKDFTKAYYMLDPSMADFLSKDALINENDVNMVEVYLRLQETDAYNRGYKTSYLQMKPILLKTTVLNMDDASAQIQINATNIRSINPLFRIVGYIFCLLEEHDVQDTLNLIKEDGAWKIAPGAFNMPI